MLKKQMRFTPNNSLSSRNALKNTIRIVLAFVLLISSALAIPLQTVHADAPIEINDCVELQKIGNDVGYPLNGDYIQGNDFSCGVTIPSHPNNAASQWNDGKGFVPIGPNDTDPFTGTFNGNDMVIDNLNIIRADDFAGIDNPGINQGADYQYVGLFGYTSGATIQDLSLTYAKVKGFYDVGGIVGYALNTTMTNLKVNEGFFAAPYTDNCSSSYCVWARFGERGGGIAGTMDGGTLTNSHTGSNVKGSGVIIGGLVGFANNGATINSSSSSAGIDGGQNVGGLVGEADAVTITDSSATGNVDARYEFDYSKLGYSGGGLVGHATDTVLTNVTASGNVTGQSYIGGLAGQFNGSNSAANNLLASGDVSATNDAGGMFGTGGCQSQVTDATASGNVTAIGNNVGGFVGVDNCFVSGGTYTDAHATGDVSGLGHVGGFIGNGRQISIQASTAVGNVTGADYYIGGFGGAVYLGIVDGSSAEGDVIGGDSVGGFFGASGCETVISGSSASGDVTGAGSGVGGFTGLDACEGPGSTYTQVSASGNATGVDNVGGLVGEAAETAVIESFATGHVVSSGTRSGGLVGQSNYSEITDSYARGSVSGGNTVGGLVGYAINTSSIINSYATGLVNGVPDLAGLVGGNDNSSAINSFWNTQTTDQPASALGTGKTTAQMRSTATFTTDLGVDTWDFDTVWARTDDNNNGYPCLQWSILCSSPESETTNDLTSAEDSTPITLAQTGCSAIESSSTTKESTHQVQDPAFQYPVGFAGFTMTGCSTSSNVNLTFTGTYDPTKAVIRKYNSVTKTYTTLTNANSGLVLTTTTLNNQPALQVSYTITDNGPLDQDPTTGTITDPVGIGTNVVGVPNTGLGGL